MSSVWGMCVFMLKRVRVKREEKDRTWEDTFFKNQSSLECMWERANRRSGGDCAGGGGCVMCSWRQSPVSVWCELPVRVVSTLWGGWGEAKFATCLLTKWGLLLSHKNTDTHQEQNKHYLLKKNVMDNKKEMLKCFNIARRQGFEDLNLFFPLIFVVQMQFKSFYHINNLKPIDSKTALTTLHWESPRVSSNFYFSPSISLLLRWRFNNVPLIGSHSCVLFTTRV